MIISSHPVGAETRPSVPEAARPAAGRISGPASPALLVHDNAAAAVAATCGCPVAGGVP